MVATQVPLWTEHAGQASAATMSLAELKQRLQVGTKLTLIEAPWLAWRERRYRTVTHSQSNAIKLQDRDIPGPPGESWLEWRRGTTVEVTGDGFRIRNACGILGYLWGHR